MVIYSHSRLSAFEQCPLKFRFKYIDKLEPEIKQSIEGFLGNRVHDTLEWIYKKTLTGKAPELDDVIEFYIYSWNKEFCSDIRIVNNELTAEHYFNKGIKFILDYFGENYPFKDNTIAVEKLITLSLDPEGKYKLKGYIDRLVHNKESNILEIHDYKTGVLKTQEEVDNDRQLALYSLAIRNEFKDAADVHLIWHFLDFNKRLQSKRSIQQLENLKQEIIQLIDKIESTTDFPPTPCILCRWCEFRKYCDFKQD